jgi:hypothetical protein
MPKKLCIFKSTIWENFWGTKAYAVLVVKALESCKNDGI